MTEVAAARHTELLAEAAAASIAVSSVTERAAAELSETVSPQGIVALCDLVDQPLNTVLAAQLQFVVVLVGISDPGNAGTVLRVADAAGADAVLFAGDTVDPHNGKCVRASTGSLFHVPIARSRDSVAVIDACRTAGLRVVAADGYADNDLDTAAAQGELDGPVAWLFGSEAHGLPDAAKNMADSKLKVPIYGLAESLNLATAAAVCLYTSARMIHSRKREV